MTPPADPITPRAAAIAYLDAFYGDLPVAEIREALAALLHPDLRFEGPFASYRSAADYIEALAADPPADCDYELTSLEVAGDEATAAYDFIRAGRRAPMTQTFHLRAGRIDRIHLDFDPPALP